MRYLRTNTATIVTVGPFYDKTDGVTIETGLTITNERISMTVDLNDGSAPTLVLDNVTGATSATSNDLNYITNCDAGLMQLELAAANVNYLGRAFLTITDAANHCPVFHEFMILPANVYDSLVLGTDYLDANSVQVGGTAQTGRDIGASVLLSSGTGTGQVSLSSGAVLLQATQTGVTIPTVTTVTNQLTAATIADAIWDEDISTGHAVANSGGKIVYDNVNAPIGTVDTVVDAISARIPAALTANGNIKASLVEILTTALTETAGLIAGAFKKFFNVATPTGTVNSLPDAVAGAAGGVFIAGANAATSITTALTTNITGDVTGNLSGSVGSVTGAVGSVTGAVGSVTGAVGSVTGNVGGNVTGSVASVTGNVGGSVGSVAANGITATSIAADAINAASVKADAVTKIQNGLATPTNITAGTITTVTNLTNAATNGDLTATMKASVNAEVDSALNTAIPGTPTADSINERIVAIGAFGAPPTAAANADAVWDEVLDTAHEVAGSASVLLQAAGTAADPWLTSLPGAYGAGTAGKIIGDNVNAPIATVQTSVNDLPTNAELATALGTADDAVLSAIAALNNLSAAQVNAEVVDVLRTDVIPDSYAAHEAQPTIAQALLEMRQFLTEKSVSGTTVSVKKPDGTTAVMEYTLDDASTPTSITRKANP